jgi:hypothetical protein
MSKLNLDDVLIICLGTADMVESLFDTSDTDTFRDWIVRDDGIDRGNAEDPWCDTAGEAVTNEVWVDESVPSSD